jgi:hypothetical protein
VVNSLLNAVTKQLGTTFGTKYHYYVENVEQALVKPCFTVDVLIPIQRSKSPVLYDRTMPLVVHYFSDSKENNKSDCYRMGELVVEALEYLPFKDTTLRGEDISWHIVEDVLEIFITYRFTTRLVVEEEEPIGELETAVAHNN